MDLGWLAHLVSRFTCNSKGDSGCEFESTGFPAQIAITKKLESNHHVNKQTFTVTPHKNISEILPLHSGIIVVLSNK